MRLLLTLTSILLVLGAYAQKNQENSPDLSLSATPDSNQNRDLNPVTVTGSRYEILLSENIASLEVIKPSDVIAQGVPTLDQALNRVAGIDVIENQINIRGGSGWSYGAGSRVLVLLNDIPMMTADASDVKWNLLPLENGYQTEILKGAASGMYGASAMNGVVNFITSYATIEPITNLQLYSGIYSQPRDHSWTWWDDEFPPYYSGLYATHKQKFGHTDLVIGGALYQEKSYLKDATESRARINGNIRRFNQKVDGLYYSLNFNFQSGKTNDFLFWDTDSNRNAHYLLPYGGEVDSTSTINTNHATRFYIDPSIVYRRSSGATHKLKNRWYLTQNRVPTSDDRSTRGDLIYSEYNFLKSYGNNDQNIQLAIGAISYWQLVRGDLYGDHQNHNLAGFVQTDFQKNNLRATLSARVESNKLDDRKRETKPVFRAGLSQKIGSATFLRGSWGQGYRFPSIAERFSSINFAAAKALPNPDLISETGWTSELGIKQLFGNENARFFIDLAVFWMQYQNMIEYNFGLHLPGDSTAQQIGIDRIPEFIGFKSLNVGDTRISGIDFSLHSDLSFSKVSLISSIGYTYMNPQYLRPDSAVLVNLSGDTDVLKYRYQNSLKLNSDITYFKWKLGFTLLYNDFMKNVDEVLTNSKPDQNIFGRLFDANTDGLSSSIQNFREENSKGQVVMDLRLSYTMIKAGSISLIGRNIGNTIYMQRPGIIAPLRSMMLQYSLSF